MQIAVRSKRYWERGCKLEKQRGKKPCHAHSYPSVWLNICYFHRMPGYKENNSLRFSEMTQRTGKSECSSVFEQTFLITSEGVWSVLVWWQPHLEREQVRLCDNSIKSMMERSLTKLYVLAFAYTLLVYSWAAKQSCLHHPHVVGITWIKECYPVLPSQPLADILFKY